MAPDGYLRGILAGGARPFRHRPLVRELLGVPADTGVRVVFPVIPRGGGFVYRHQLDGGAVAPASATPAWQVQVIDDPAYPWPASDDPVRDPFGTAGNEPWPHTAARPDRVSAELPQAVPPTVPSGRTDGPLSGPVVSVPGITPPPAPQSGSSALVAGDPEARPAVAAGPAARPAPAWDSAGRDPIVPARDSAGRGLVAPDRRAGHGEAAGVTATGADRAPRVWPDDSPGRPAGTAPLRATAAVSRAAMPATSPPSPQPPARLVSPTAPTPPGGAASMPPAPTSGAAVRRSPAVATRTSRAHSAPATADVVPPRPAARARQRQVTAPQPLQDEPSPPPPPPRPGPVPPPAAAPVVVGPPESVRPAAFWERRHLGRLRGRNLR